LAERLAGGLAALHAGGSAHGDLTPSSVVLAEDGPRLVRFGLARAAGPEFGTPGYQAPEQTAGGAAEATVPAGVSLRATGGQVARAGYGMTPVEGGRHGAG